MKVSIIYLILSVLVHFELFAQDTIPVFGGNYVIKKRDSSFIYLKPLETTDTGTIRLKRVRHVTNAEDGDFLSLDSCFFPDNDIINCGGATGVSIKNSYCAGKILIIGSTDTSKALLDNLSTIVSMMALKSLRLLNVYGKSPTLYGIICDSLTLEKMNCTSILLNTAVIKSYFSMGFAGMGGNSLEIANVQIYGSANIRTYGLNKFYIQRSGIESLMIGSLDNLTPAGFNTIASTYGSITFQNPFLRVNCNGVYVKNFLKLDDSYVKLFVRGEDGDVFKKRSKDGFAYFKEAEYKTNISLAGLTMLEDSKLYLPPTLTPSQLQMNSTSLLNSYVYLVLDSAALYREYGDVQDYFFKTIQFYQDSSKMDDDRKKELTERLNYQKTLYKERMIGAEPFSIGKMTKLIWMKFLKFTVNYGYKGEKAFVITLGIFILIWSLIYYFRFGEEIVRYLVSLNEESSFNKETTGIISEGKKFLMCCWFSFVVFANPRFPSSYFMFTQKLFKWLWREWLFGLLLFVLFIVYIASKYNFIQKMFGF